MISETPPIHKDDEKAPVENVNSGNDLENRIKEAEVKMRESEARLKETEANLREKELNSQPNTDPNNWKTTISSLSAPVVLAVVAIAGTVIGSVISGVLNIRLEREKLRNNLIQKATEGDVAAKVKSDRLKFLVKTGIIEDPEGQINEYIENPENIPTLLPLNTTQPEPIVGDGWLFIGTFVNGKWTQKTVNIPNKLPEAGDSYSVTDDVYLRNDHPTEDNRVSNIIKTVNAGASIQILERHQVPNTSIYWCKVSINTSGTLDPRAPATNGPNQTKP